MKHLTGFIKNFFVLNATAALVAILALSAVMPAPTTHAAQCKTQNTIAFLPRWYENLCKEGTDTIMSPTDMPNSSNTGQQLGTWLSVIGLNIVTIILYIVGYVSLFFIIWGGFKYMTQGDSSSGTVAARKTIQNAIIGLILSILSVAIVQFIVGGIRG